MSDHGDSAENTELPSFRLTITPDPEGDEGEALIAAIAVYLSASEQTEPQVEEEPATTRWGTTGRRSGIRGINDEKQMGWGRRRAGWP